jgi:DNA polymerase-3 subunit gamma/tau
MSSSNKTVNQIKNIVQQNKSEPKMKSQNVSNEIKISSFIDLIDLCNKKKEIKLKYELENNVNLVTFSESRMEIAFNENLDKSF